MANMDDKGGARARAVVSDDLAGSAFSARVGTSEFAVGGQSGVDPYELLSVSRVACRLHRDDAALSRPSTKILPFPPRGRSVLPSRRRWWSRRVLTCDHPARRT
jgi:hypothetical protein